MLYLDVAAAAPVRRDLLERHAEFCREYVANPHGVTCASERSRRAIREAEGRVLALAGTRDRDATVVWTSGGTEAANLAIFGVRPAADEPVCVVDAASHHGVLEPVRMLSKRGWHCHEAACDRSGRVAATALAEFAGGGVDLAAVCHVNNETGAVQDLVAVRGALQGSSRRSLLLVDALQSFCRLPVPWDAAGIDMMVVGGRKLGGPASVGALILRNGIGVAPILFGGGQQRGVRSGTLDTVGIVEFALAAELAAAEARQRLDHLVGLNCGLRRMIREQLAAYAPVFVSPDEACPQILAVSFPGYEGAIVARALAQKDIVIGTGSACTAESAETSHVLRAMGIDTTTARGMIRISFGAEIVEQDLQRLVAELAAFLADY